MHFLSAMNTRNAEDIVCNVGPHTEVHREQFVGVNRVGKNGGRHDETISWYGKQDHREV